MAGLTTKRLTAYRNPRGQIQLFRPAMNAARMAHSSGFVSIPKMPIPLFLQCLHLAVGLNSEYVPPHETDASLYCRAIAFASSASPGIRLALEYTMCIYVVPVGPLHGPRAVDALIVEDIDRAAPLGTGSAKIGGNYGPMLGVVDRAIREGYGLTLHLDSKTHTAIDEFSTSAFIGVRAQEDQYTIVVSDSGQIVNSVTSDSVCEIARTLGWKVEKRTVSPSPKSGSLGFAPRGKGAHSHGLSSPRTTQHQNASSSAAQHALPAF
jgi:branched-chain amino acid aminotransferase